ncbi:hypothetical protein BH10BAC4_BH10BAC4_07020 [soil metagenome]
MSRYEFVFNLFYSKLLSEKARKKSELIIILVAINGFILHLLLITLVHFDIVRLTDYSELFRNPLVAIYTPFSFILIYEVYLLVYYLPKSISKYIGKQYEIITLIIIRKIYNDLSKLEFTSDWFSVKSDLQFTYDIIAAIILFFLIFVFYRLNEKKEEEEKDRPLSLDMVKFIKMKKIIATCLVPVLVVLAIYNLGQWVYVNFFSIGRLVDSFRDSNKIFFDEFFTVLILIDVLLLLISFLHTDKFNQVIRNSGFIISTILIKLSFGIEGLLNTILTVVAVLIGVAILSIHNQYEKRNQTTNS